MTWQGFVAAVFVVPALTLFLGVGVLAWNVGQTWDARSTDSLIVGTSQIHVKMCSRPYTNIAVMKRHKGSDTSVFLTQKAPDEGTTLGS